MTVVPVPARRRSKGVVLLVRTGLSGAEIARRVGLSQVAVYYWMAGITKPGKAARAKLHQGFNIPPDAWEEGNDIAPPKQNSG